MSIAHSISSLFMLSFILKTYAMEDVAHTVGVFRAREFEGMGEIYSLLLWKCFWSFYKNFFISLLEDCTNIQLCVIPWVL